MFGKDPAASESKLNSIIGKGSNCEGEIVVGGGLKIDGNFKGTVKAASVFVGKEAVVEATIDTNVAVIGGKVIGNVIAHESIELQPKAEVVGDVQTKNLIVAEAAVLDGYCDMGRGEGRRQKEKPATTAAKEHQKGSGPQEKAGTPHPATPSTPHGGGAPANTHRPSPHAGGGQPAAGPPKR